jgi:PEGA domain
MRCTVLASVGLLLLGSGCVQRTVTVTSDPPGALVYANGNEVGRTPLKRDFIWYGTYDVQLRKEGYETLDTRGKVIAPIWQWPPFDFFAEFWPWHLKDEQKLEFKMTPASTQPIDPEAIIVRAAEMQGQLETSKFTRAATQPAP